MRDRKLKEQFSATAERLSNAQLTAEQLFALRSIQYFYIHNNEQGVCAKLRTFLIGALILPFVAVCLTLSPLSQLAAILFEFCDLEVIYVAVLRLYYTVCFTTTSILPLLMVSWRPPMASTVHQTYKL